MIYHEGAGEVSSYDAPLHTRAHQLRLRYPSPSDSTFLDLILAVLGCFLPHRSERLTMLNKDFYKSVFPSQSLKPGASLCSSETLLSSPPVPRHVNQRNASRITTQYFPHWYFTSSPNLSVKTLMRFSTPNSYTLNRAQYYHRMDLERGQHCRIPCLGTSFREL